MPELPEVETTRRGISPYVLGRVVKAVHIHNKHLRWPVPSTLVRDLPGQTIQEITRRAKYLLLKTERGTLIIHLGMSGSLRVTSADLPTANYEHVELVFTDGQALRLRDPRRFGAVLWTSGDHSQHKLLKNLGPEPFSKEFNGQYLYDKARGRRVAIRDFLMNTRIVAGIGNIYANEALFLAGLRPHRPAGRVSRQAYLRLAKTIRQTLQKAIRAGGTTLRDFYNSDGSSGYFQLRLKVYGRTNKPCQVCKAPIRQIKLGQRSGFYCPRCQT